MNIVVTKHRIEVAQRALEIELQPVLQKVDNAAAIAALRDGLLVGKLAVDAVEARLEFTRVLFNGSQKSMREPWQKVHNALWRLRKASEGEPNMPRAR